MIRITRKRKRKRINLFTRPSIPLNIELVKVNIHFLFKNKPIPKIQ